MPASLVEGNSLLAIEIGSVTTRAAYFDVVEGQYRFISMAQSPTTANAPFHNVVYGVKYAIEELQNLIGKPLMDEDGRLTIPSQPDGIGVDNFAATISAGDAIKTVVVGLLPDVSLKSVENLAQTWHHRRYHPGEHRAAPAQSADAHPHALYLWRRECRARE